MDGLTEWPTGGCREQTLDSMYTLQSQTHMATIHQLHDVLKANIELLQQVTPLSVSPPSLCRPPLCVASLCL